MGTAEQVTKPFVDALYREFLSRGVCYFFRSSSLTEDGPAPGNDAGFSCTRRGDGTLGLVWLGAEYTLSMPDRAFTEQEERFVQSVGDVLLRRYHILSDTELVARNLNLFRGVPEDRFVSAFLEEPPDELDPHLACSDRIADAIDLMRTAALSKHENRPISTGAILLGQQPDSLHRLPAPSAEALAYTSDLISIRSFHRICDGLQTIAIVNSCGLFTELVDIQRWSEPMACFELPAPATSRYQMHSRATLCGGHICLILTPNGEIKIFSGGVQVFAFLNGRWRLTDLAEKYNALASALSSTELATRLFQSALDLAEDRRGALFVVLDDPRAATKLVRPGDRLDTQPVNWQKVSPKVQLHYLLRRQKATAIAPSVLETIARIDGSVVLDREANLLAFGAILRDGAGGEVDSHWLEGARSSAALAASKYGNVLKVSEDGEVSFYRYGEVVWEL